MEQKQEPPFPVFWAIGGLSALGGVAIMLFGAIWAYIIWSQFNTVGGGSFLGNTLADLPSIDYSYSVIMFLDIIVMILGGILVVLGAIVLEHESEAQSLPKAAGESDR